MGSNGRLVSSREDQITLLGFQLFQSGAKCGFLTLDSFIKFLHDITGAHHDTASLPPNALEYRHKSLLNLHDPNTGRPAAKWAKILAMAISGLLSFNIIYLMRLTVRAKSQGILAKTH